MAGEVEANIYTKYPLSPYVTCLVIDEGNQSSVFLVTPPYTFNTFRQDSSNKINAAVIRYSRISVNSEDDT